MGDNQSKQLEHLPAAGQTPVPTSQCIDWYAEGESRTVEVGEIQISIRLIGRRGRRSRIAITAPSGASFKEQQQIPTTLAQNKAARQT